MVGFSALASFSGSGSIAQRLAMVARRWAMSSPLHAALTIRNRWSSRSTHRRTRAPGGAASTRSASRAGKHIPLTPREYALLEFLARKAGQLVTRAEIWENLYAMDSNTTSNVVDVYIGYLRKKLDTPGAAPIIHTRRGSGFILGTPD